MHEPRVSPLRVVTRSVAGYLARRFPLETLGVGILLAFFCSHALYGLTAGTPAVARSTVLGAASLLLLFLELRIADDLDDVDRDLAREGAAGPGARETVRRGLIAGLITCQLALLALNVGHPQALGMALVAGTFAVAVPFVVKPHTTSRILLAIAYEGTPALMLAYVYFFWRGRAPVSLPARQVLAVVGVCWVPYEFWKFSRKAGTSAPQPYNLGAGGVRFVLALLLLLSVTMNVAVCLIARLPPIVAAYGAVIPAGFGLWLRRVWPATAAAPATRGFGVAGLAFVVALESGLLAALLLR